MEQLYTKIPWQSVVTGEVLGIALITDTYRTWTVYCNTAVCVGQK